jgi:hypothetical protein
MNRTIIKIFLLIVPIPLIILVSISYLKYKKEDIPIHYSYNSEHLPSEIRFKGKTVSITEIDDPNKVQEVMDRNPANAVIAKGSKIITGHKEGGFGNLTELKNGDLVEISDNLGLMSRYSVKDVVDVRVDNLGTGGVVRSRSDSKKISDWKSNPEIKLLQTCLFVGENDYLVRIVAIKKNLL